MTLRFGDGPLQGWRVEAGPPAERETTGRGALLQAVLYQEAGDAEAEWLLLDSQPSGGLPLAHELAAALLERHAELAEEFCAATSSLEQVARSEGYTLLHLGQVAPFGSASALTAAITEAEKALGPAEVEEWPGRRVVALWPSGEVLAFERHPSSRILWRDCSAAVADELDAEERSVEAPLEQPAAELVQAMQERLGGEPQEGLADRYQDDPPTAWDKLRAEFDSAMDEIASRREHGRPAPEVQGEVQDQQGSPTIWDHLAASQPASPPGDAWCCSCTTGFAGQALRYQDGGGGYVSWAHPECVDAERVDAEREANKAAARLAAQDPRLALALGANACKPFRARHRGETDPACELCLQAIHRGDMSRRKSPTSNKRMHDACVREVLDGREDVA